MPTARNARGIDIIAYTSDASQFVGIQVKTLSKRNAVPLGKNLDIVVTNGVVYIRLLMCSFLFNIQVWFLAVVL